MLLISFAYGLDYSMKLVIKFEQDYSSWQTGYLVSYNGEDFYYTSDNNSDCLFKKVTDQQGVISYQMQDPFGTCLEV